MCSGTRINPGERKATKNIKTPKEFPISIYTLTNENPLICPIRALIKVAFLPK
jgi:hypothetical protein